jgi:S1-C subfamily serine protease
MSVITHLFALLLIGFLSFTNTLADKIFQLTDTDNESLSVVESPLHTLPSQFSAIPDILLESASYQQSAAVANATQNWETTTDPMQAIVNIYCTSVTKTMIRTTTGTGFFIHPSGIIMTNAHVAQFLLLENTGAFGDTSCIIRNGNPAAPRYHAELLYISPAWIKNNASLIDNKAPSGTGERDYALLYVTSSMDDSPLPKQFPALAFDAAPMTRTVTNNQVTAAGYPAGAFLRGGSDTDLFPREATTSIADLYTFTTNQADVIALRGSSMGEQGASGGPVLNRKGAVIGMITTRGNDTTDGAGSLHAITLTHINSTITQETGISLASNLVGNVPTRAIAFASTMSPFLTNILVGALGSSTATIKNTSGH